MARSPQVAIYLHVQVDGPWHFSHNTLQPLGPTLLKRRLLAAAGWQLLSIPFHEWVQLSDRAAKQVTLSLVISDFSL